MTNTSSLTSLRNALALRKKKKVLTLRLAIAKAESMEAVYGKELARPLWIAVGEAERLLALTEAPKV